VSAAILGFALAVPLAVASRLEPSPLNMGTHEQLGLPPCSVVVLFGHRCPACGMTTAWAHLVRGHGMEAFRANVGGALLGILDLVAVPWLLVSSLRGRWLGWVPDMTVLAWVLGGIMVVTLVDWVVRLIGG
jgi:hypothetical protein